MPNTRTWDPNPTASAHALERLEVIAAADRVGVLLISSPRLARLAGVCPKTAWAWLRGYPTSPDVDAACRRALGLEALAQSDAA